MAEEPNRVNPPLPGLKAYTDAEQWGHELGIAAKPKVNWV
jgi:hypothetical protein